MACYFDYETHLITRAALAARPVCLSWAIGDAPADIALYRDAPVRELWEGPHELVGANTAFEAVVSQAADLELTPAIFAKYSANMVRDVQLDAQLLDIADGQYGHYKAQGWGLEVLARRSRYPKPLNKTDWRLRYCELDGVALRYWPRGAIDYSLEDSEVTRWVDAWNQARRRALIDKLGVDPLGFHSYHAARASFVLTRASCWGVLTDEGRTNKVAANVAQRAHELLYGETDDEGHTWPGLIEAGLVRFKKNAKEPSRCIAAATERIVKAWRKRGVRAALSDSGDREIENAKKRGMDVDAVHARLEDTGYGISLDKDAAILCGDELMVRYSEYVSLDLLDGRVQRARQGFVLPLQTRFKVLVETARTSSTQPGEDSGLIGEQMQNFNRGKKDEALGLRELFTPRPGNVFLGADGAQAELHALAEVCRKLFGFSRLGDLLDSNVDVHWYFAAQMLGITYEQILADKDKYKNYRTMAKAVNFGLPGGMGVDKLILSARKGYGVKIEPDEGKRLKALWLATFPEIRLYFDWVSSQGDGFTHIHPITGFVRGDCGYCDGANQGFQHLIAYAMKDALWLVDTACNTPGNPLFGFRLWNFVHDELLLEGPRERAPAAAVELKRLTEQACNAYLLTSPLEADPVIMPYWSKKFESQKDEHGNYIECVPEAA